MLRIVRLLWESTSRISAPVAGSERLPACAAGARGAGLAGWVARVARPALAARSGHPVTGPIFDEHMRAHAGSEPRWLMGVRLPGASSCAPGNG